MESQSWTQLSDWACMQSFWYECLLCWRISVCICEGRDMGRQYEEAEELEPMGDALVSFLMSKASSIYPCGLFPLQAIESNWGWHNTTLVLKLVSTDHLDRSKSSPLGPLLPWGFQSLQETLCCTALLWILEHRERHLEKGSSELSDHRAPPWLFMGLAQG